MRPLLKVAGPAWRLVGRPAAGGLDATARFGLRRLTPGNLGLELTTLIAIAGVGVFTFFLLGARDRRSRASRGSTGWRSTSPTRCASSRSTSIVEVLTHLGSSPVIAAARARHRVLCALRRRRWIDAAALVAGAALTYAAVHIAKAAYDRPRPPGALVDTVARLPIPRATRPTPSRWSRARRCSCAAGVGWAVRFGRRSRSRSRLVASSRSAASTCARTTSRTCSAASRSALAIWALVGHRRPVRRGRSSQ